MSTDMALTVEFSIMFLSGMVAIAAGTVYYLTESEHGGWVCLLFIFIALSVGGDLYSNAQAVLAN